VGSLLDGAQPCFDVFACLLWGEPIVAQMVKAVKGDLVAVLHDLVRDIGVFEHLAAQHKKGSPNLDIGQSPQHQRRRIGSRPVVEGQYGTFRLDPLGTGQLTPAACTTRMPSGQPQPQPMWHDVGDAVADG
jgi:hypothetical protein